MYNLKRHRYGALKSKNASKQKPTYIWKYKIETNEEG